LHQFKIECTLSALPRIPIADLQSNQPSAISTLFHTITRHAFAIISLAPQEAELLSQSAQIAQNYFEKTNLEGSFLFFSSLK
jgi:hypothetical protein